jgi:hypothetical protein
MAAPAPVPRTKSTIGKLKSGLRSLFGGKAAPAAEDERDAAIVPASRLTVMEALMDGSDTPGQVYMSAKTMAMGDEDAEDYDDTRALFDGDAVMIKGKLKRSVVCYVVVDSSMEDHAVRISTADRKNLRVGPLDTVSVSSVQEIGNVATLVLQPLEESIEGISGDLVATFIDPYFTGFKLISEDGEQVTPRIVRVGDYIECPGAFQPVWFFVKDLQTEGGAGDADAGGAARGAAAGAFGYVNYAAISDPGVNPTHVELGEPLEGDRFWDNLQAIGYADIGGLKKQLDQIREVVELPLKFPKLFKAIGAKPPKGVLMHGPPGCGKTLIARAISNELGCNFRSVQGPELMSGQQGGSEKAIRELFKKAAEEAPCVVFFDEIDSIAPNREKTQDETMRRVVATLLTCMDGMKGETRVMVIGATNRPNAMDPALRRAGRFDAEIVIPVPSKEARVEILTIMTKVSVLLFTVTFHANHAHNLTRSPTIFDEEHALGAGRGLAGDRRRDARLRWRGSAQPVQESRGDVHPRARHRDRRYGGGRRAARAALQHPGDS